MRKVCATISSAALIVALTSPARAAGPGPCINACQIKYYQCLATHGGGDPAYHGAAVAFCLDEQLKCIRFCVNTWVIVRTFGWGLMNDLYGGGTPDDIPDQTANVIARGLKRTTLLLDRAFDKGVRQLEKGLGKMEDALELARAEGSSVRDLDTIGAAIAAGQALLAALEDVTFAQCYMAVDLGLEAPPPDTVEPVELSRLVDGLRVDPSALEGEPSRKLRRRLEQAAAAYDRGDARYGNLHVKMVESLRRLESDLAKLADKGRLDPTIAAVAAADLSAAAEHLQQDRALRACFDAGGNP